jgi:hypothetical protein
MAIPLSPPRTQRPSFFHVRKPATRVASGRWTRIRKRFDAE